jgi:hypothetical protein
VDLLHEGSRIADGISVLTVTILGVKFAGGCVSILPRGAHARLGHSRPLQRECCAPGGFAHSD